MGNINIELTASAMARNIREKGKRFDFDYSQGMNGFNNGNNNPEKGDNAYIAKQVATLVRNEVKLYKNDFKASLTAFIDFAKEALENRAPSKASLYTIVEVSLPEICNEADSLKIFNGNANYSNIRSLDLTKFKAVDIDALSNTKASLDKYYKEFFPNGITAEEMVKLFNSTIQDDFENTVLININNIVKSWIVFNYLKDNEINCNLTVSELVSIIGWLDSQIARTIKLYNTYVKDERVLITVEHGATNVEVYVVKDVYNSLLGLTGIVDAIFGLAIRKDKEYMGTAKLTNQDIAYYKTGFTAAREELIRDWNTFIAVGSVENSYLKYKRISYGYRLAFEKTLDLMDPTLRSYSTYTVNQMRDLLEKHMMGKILYGSSEEIEDMAIFITGSLLFNRTNYAKFLAIGERYLANNPDLQPEDVIGYIITELVTELYLGKMAKFDIN